MLAIVADVCLDNIFVVHEESEESTDADALQADDIDALTATEMAAQLFGFFFPEINWVLCFDYAHSRDYTRK